MNSHLLVHLFSDQILTTLTVIMEVHPRSWVSPQCRDDCFAVSQNTVLTFATKKLSQLSIFSIKYSLCRQSILGCRLLTEFRCRSIHISQKVANVKFNFDVSDDSIQFVTHASKTYHLICTL